MVARDPILMSASWARIAATAVHEPLVVARAVLTEASAQDARQKDALWVNLVYSTNALTTVVVAVTTVKKAQAALVAALAKPTFICAAAAPKMAARAMAVLGN